MPPNTSAFALRMPPEVKEAARELSNTYFHEPSDKGEEYVNSVAFGKSINEALNFLLLRGLRTTHQIVQDYSAEVQKEHDRFSTFMTFFMANPIARNVCPFNLPEDSEPRKWLKAVMELQPEDFPEGADRPWVADEYASTQRHLEQLSRTVGAIQRALAANPR